MKKLIKTAKETSLDVRSANSIKVALLLFVFCFSACKQSELANEPSGSSSKGSAAKVSGPQPLPAGRAYWSVALGRFNPTSTNDNIWNRIITWTFDASTGTVNGSAYTWSSTNKVGKTLFTGASHKCTWDGVYQPSCNVYTPTGFVYPSGQYVSWSGTYTYVGTTLTISWSTIGGNSTSATDSWTIVDYPTYGVARANFISSNYNLTHGHGYGSTSHWSNFKTMANTPRVEYVWEYGRHVVANGSTGSSTDTTRVSGWKRAGMGLNGFTSPTSSTTVLHHKKPTESCDTVLVADGGGCATTRTGIIYHMASQNTTRQVVYNNFCACLPAASEYPCYTRNNHPSAFMQVINDSHELVGYIGIEAQNPTEASYGGAFQFQLMDFTNIPGAGF